jgi:Thiolase, C-terminal domain
VEGGAVAHGHPIGATGAVLTTKLIHSMRRDGLSRGPVTFCLGGGKVSRWRSKCCTEDAEVEIASRNAAARDPSPWIAWSGGEHDSVRGQTDRPHVSAQGAADTGEPPSELLPIGSWRS